MSDAPKELYTPDRRPGEKGGPPITPSALSPTYTCQICRKTFGIQGTPIIGEKDEQRALRTVQMLAQHLQTEHKEAIVTAALAGQQVSAWLFMKAFKHNDAYLAADAEKIRKNLRQASFSPTDHISDEMIIAQVDAHISPHFEDGMDYARNEAIEVLKTLRDRLEGAPPQKT